MGIVLNVHSQITIRESNNVIVQKEESTEFKTFDSTTNIISLRVATDYKKYIGQTLFFLPSAQSHRTHRAYRPRPINYLFTKESTMVTPRRAGDGARPVEQSTEFYKACGGEKTETCPDSVEGKYFTILNIRGQKIVNRVLESFRNLDDIEGSPYGLEFTLKNNANGDILFWRTTPTALSDYFLTYNANHPFLLVSYFEKQRGMYQSQNFVVRSVSDIASISTPGEMQRMRNIVDINTGEKIELKEDEMWLCYDVSMVDTETSYYLAGFYFLRNRDREIQFRLGSGDIERFFMTEAEFQEVEKERQRVAEEERQSREEARQKREEELQVLRDEYIKMWGSELGNVIANGRVRVGMTQEMCRAAWGEPTSVNRTTTGRSTTEQWVYDYGNYLYFENGVLTTIQN